MLRGYSDRRLAPGVAPTPSVRWVDGERYVWRDEVWVLEPGAPDASPPPPPASTSPWRRIGSPSDHPPHIVRRS